MADGKVLTPYELLVRWKEETGEFSGAMMTYWSRRIFDGEVVQNTQLQPIAVQLADLPAEIANLNTSTIKALNAAELALAAKDVELEQKSSQASGLVDKLASLNAQIDQLQMGIRARDQQIADLQAK